LQAVADEYTVLLEQPSARTPEGASKLKFDDFALLQQFFDMVPTAAPLVILLYFF
jgi:hypothetical protein